MVGDARLQALLEQGEEAGCLNLSAVTEFLQEAELDEEQTTGFFEQLEERSIPLTDDCARPDAAESTYVNGDWEEYQAYRIERETKRLYPHRHLVEGPQFAMAV